ncbi:MULTISPECIES: amidohydrolase [unclassified Sporosarcina]|uniref:amidohydrolase n=1 Tax=unclassified Sporosarcina TaxID=2647733 RepID=UPI002041B2FB|nr:MULTISPECIES: amidohydrolase family protein [unclassified Sporosarcina]GKV65894.1 imidazolonepropionase [Sporosarcina sp. NCCP-2331]GLB56019.1 imidazolonepropionase [Sporosarcina sp. NCCP-2378]
MLLVKNALVYKGFGTPSIETIAIVEGKFADPFEESQLENAVIDAKGKVITPGLIDVHTHLGINQQGVGEAGHDFNESSSDTTPEVNTIDAITMRDSGFEDARRAGVTTVQVMPGSANIIGGEMVVIKTAGTVVDKCIVRNPSGLKAAMGENPKAYHRQTVQTRMGIAARLREQFLKADYYAAQRKAGKCPPNLGLDHIVKVLHREIPLRVHAHRADDIATVLRIQKEFQIEVSIEHGTEGHLVTDLLAGSNIPVAVGPTMSTRPKFELAEQTWETVRALDEANISISLTTDHPVVGIEHLMTSAILAIKNGLTEEKALQTITLNAAKHLGIADQVGSIEWGKDADFVIWNGDPFDLRSVVERTYIGGECVYEKV